ncbi:unnamed protein product, partial [Didymodactylos carnosus]
SAAGYAATPSSPKVQEDIIIPQRFGFITLKPDTITKETKTN